MRLVDYLASLNASTDQWGLYVNPTDLDDYRVEQLIFDNGGLLDGKVYVGTLEDLSCGYQCQVDAIKTFLEDNERFGIAEIKYKNKLVRCKTESIIDAWSEDKLDPEFQEFLESEAEEIELEWAKNEAELKVEELQEFFAPGGDYEENSRQMVLGDGN
jgi:hypothetical protein